MWILLALASCKGDAHLDDACREALAASPADVMSELVVLAEHCPSLLPIGCPQVVRAMAGARRNGPKGAEMIPVGLVFGVQVKKACFDPRCGSLKGRYGDPVASLAEEFIERCDVEGSDLLTPDERRGITHPPPVPPEVDVSKEPSRLFENYDRTLLIDSQREKLIAWVESELLYLGGRGLVASDRERFRAFLRQGVLARPEPTRE